MPTKPPGAKAAAAAGVVAAEVVVAVGGDGEERVTIWNRTTQRQVSGMAAPQRRRLAAWLVDNPACEVCTGLGRILAVYDRSSTA